MSLVPIDGSQQYIWWKPAGFTLLNMIRSYRCVICDSQVWNIAGLGTFKPELIMKVRLAFSNAGILMTGRQSLVPVVTSGIIAVYRLVSVLISGSCM